MSVGVLGELVIAYTQKSDRNYSIAERIGRGATLR